MKRVVSIQDVSCVGKCSQTVALPIISAMGVETAVIPTAVLSTHTAFFKGFTFHDLTAEIAPITAHWKKEGLAFDGIYTGYLGSFEQLDLVSKMIDDFKTEKTFVCIDPVMADGGKLYPGFSQEFADSMAKLCGKADIVVPNLSEACFMLHIPYPENGVCAEPQVREILQKLVGLGAKKALLTGVSFEKGKLGVMGYEKETDRFFTYFSTHLPVSFHGTGDVFASACVGALARGKSLEQAAAIAVDYTVDCIRKTMEDPEAVWYGVNFEQALPGLIESMKA